MNKFTRRAFFSTSAITVGTLLSGCQDPGQPPEVYPGPEGPSQPKLGPERMQVILSQVQAALKAGDEALDVTFLTPRVSGSASEFRAASYEIIKKVPEHADSLTRPSAQTIVPLASAEDTFPRYALALVEAEEEDGLPYFIGLQQNDATSNYTAWGWVRQAAGIEMPTVPGIEFGAQIVPEDANDLYMSPLEAINGYISVLNDGHHNGDLNDDFIEDPFQQTVHEDIQAERARINEGVEQDEVATVREIYQRRGSEYLGLRTADGGAIVMASLTSTRRLEVRSGLVSYAQENLVTKLLGTTEFSNEIIRDYGTTILLYIPPAQEDARIQPIGAYKVLLSASGS